MSEGTEKKFRYSITSTTTRRGVYYQVFDHDEGRTTEFCSYDREEAAAELVRLSGRQKLPFPKFLT